MSKEITCCCCRERIKANPRLKGNQQYCSKSECRKTRRRLWQHKKMHNDVDYNSKQRGLVKRWRKGKPAHEYMAEYRQNHPEYVKSNRQKQTGRNLTRREREKMLMGEDIVKMDSLSVSPAKTNTYQMISFRRNKTGKIVKMDSLIVQLKQIKALSLQERMIMI